MKFSYKWTARSHGGLFFGFKFIYPVSLVEEVELPDGTISGFKSAGTLYGLRLGLGPVTISLDVTKKPKNLEVWH